MVGSTEQRSPFQGLGFYTEDDARWFFGRATERKIILAHLRTARLTLLYAESGVGKSSLLRAGVGARLRELATQNIDA
ncbi:MAG: nSTAND1 domain-containing NTPase, partial [Solirubrobacteraceae bacterium]